MKREKLDNLIQWKNTINKKPLIIYGARQVGKTYLVSEFAKNYYQYFYHINFEINVDAQNIFSGNLDIKTLLLQLSAYKPNIPIIEGKTLLFFDEAQKCPQVLTALKTFALDNRFDVIASGSMLGISLSEVSSYPVGYVETLEIKPMSFKEFLWVKGYTDEIINNYHTYFQKEIPFPKAIHEILTKSFLEYIIVGGMPEVVLEFINTNNLYNIKKIQKRILNDYRNDIAKYTKKLEREKIRSIFDIIPDQLAKENKKFQYKIISKTSNARGYLFAINWINDTGLTNRLYRLNTLDIPLKAYRDLNMFKLYFFDTGLLLSFYNEDLSYEILNGNLGVFKGAIYENIIAQVLKNNNLDLYYYQKSDYLEIDFIASIGNKIIPIEVKSSTNTRAVSIKNLVLKENLDYGIIFSINNLNCSNPKIKFIPIYCAMFIK